MSFARQRCTWTPQHIPGEKLKAWEQLGDAADKHMCPVPPRQTGLPSLDLFIERMVADSSLHVGTLPKWVDRQLLDDGMRFFVETWPLVFVSFGWAVVGGFGCESASAVLLESRYWASDGESGRRDTWKRLRETACWLYDICAPGAQAFEPGGAAWTAALHVRYLHSRTRAELAAKHPGGVGSFAAEFGAPINQLQLVGTLLGSSALLLEGIERAMGLPLRARDKDGFLHLWRLVGHLFGIDDEKNPNVTCAHARTVMESVFLYAIPAAPRAHLTHALSSHIYKAVCQGTKEDYGVPVSEAVLAAQARLYLGTSYSDAIGLPSVTWLQTLIAITRLAFFRVLFAPYFLLGADAAADASGAAAAAASGKAAASTAASSRIARAAAVMGAVLHARVIRLIYHFLMRRSFASLVHRVRVSQPACRFGKSLDATQVTKAE